MSDTNPDAFELLLRVAADCRAKQKTYFDTRRKPDLRAAEKAESILDALITKYQPTAQETLPLDEPADPSPYDGTYSEE